MNIRVVDDRKKLLGEGRDLAALVSEFRSNSPVEVVTTRNNLERVNVTRWDFDDLPLSGAASQQARRYWPTPR